MSATWHPASQMKDYETFSPLWVDKAHGSYFILKDGRSVIDAISSWWCKSLGHQHPRLKAAMLEQADKFEHIILANTNYDVIDTLSQRLCALTDHMHYVFYASEGSSAVEIAMKMSLHSRKIKGDNQKTRFLALQNGYHGETLGALSVSDLGLYKHPYADLLIDVPMISSIPYVLNQTDPLWHDCSLVWPCILQQLNPYATNTTAIILEPIVQGAGGMKIYSQDFLKRLDKWCHQHDIHLIVDEIMTGICRTGKMFAYQHANIQPDFICLGKGLTAGYMPLSAVMTTESIYQLFYNDYEMHKAFLHSHTFSGHALAARIALEVLDIVRDENLCSKANELGANMFNAMQEIAHQTGALTQVRQIGAIVAADLINQTNHPRLGYAVYQKAVELGALLRPLGDTIYWLPPFNATMETINELKNITTEAVLSIKP